MTSLTANQRFFDVQNEPQQMLLPIQGYDDMPLLSLKISVENLERMISTVIHNAHIATERSAYPDNGLTQDESAAICLYTMNSKSNDQSLCARLNFALRSKDRSELIPYFFYLKLFLSALSKLQSVKKTVWRGVKADLTNQYPVGKIVTWWGFSSCIESFDEIQSDKFVGKIGTRTLFQIQCETGKAISAHSYYHDINEILLLPATQLQVIDQINCGNDLHIIHMKEIKPSFSFLQSPLPSFNLNTLTKRTDKKANSAITLPSARWLTNPLGAQRSKSFSSSTTLSISNMQRESVKKITKPYENKLLKELINQERKKQSFRFSEQMPNYDDVEMIANEMTSNKSWTIMHLWKNSMNERHMNILIRGLKLNSTLMCLNLDHNRLDDDGATVLARGLKSNTCLRSLYLNENHISDIGAEELGYMLYVNKTLTHLELSSNTIGDNGVAAISDALKVNKHLRTICLNDNKMTVTGAAYLGDMLQVNTTLLDLQVSSNSIGDDGVNAIIHALQQNTTLESLHIGETTITIESMQIIGDMLERNTILKCLYLNKNDLGDEALMILIPALMKNTTLTTLDLSMNNLTDKSADEVAYLLEQTHISLTTLIISENPLGDIGIASIASALMKNTTLIKLMIESVEMTSEGVRELAMMLCSNKELRYLALNNNKIDESSMKLLADALQHNNSLQYLYLNSCDVKDECVSSVIDIMNENTTLVSIELVKNRLTEQGKMAIKEASILNKTCSLYLDFTFHRVH